MFDFLKNNPNKTKSAVSSSRTSSRLVTLKHEWTIDHFDLCHQSVNVKSCAFLDSTKFCPPDQPDMHFNLRICPRGGYSEPNRKYILLYVISNTKKPFWYHLKLIGSLRSTETEAYRKSFSFTHDSIKGDSRGGSQMTTSFSWFDRPSLSHYFSKIFSQNNYVLAECKIRYVTDVETIET